LRFVALSFVVVVVVVVVVDDDDYSGWPAGVAAGGG
jgi:hypothetical protein